MLGYDLSILDPSHDRDLFDYRANVYCFQKIKNHSLLAYVLFFVYFLIDLGLNMSHSILKRSRTLVTTLDTI